MRTKDVGKEEEKTQEPGISNVTLQTGLGASLGAGYKDQTDEEVQEELGLMDQQELKEAEDADAHAYAGSDSDSDSGTKAEVASKASLMPNVLREDAMKADEEEFAAEVAPSAASSHLQEAEQEERKSAQDSTIGLFALVLAIASLFVIPSILGPVAAILGFVAYTRGSRGLGVWSIGIGILSFVAYFVLLPLYT
ncbi:hypothetical protein [Marinicrinis sediminis]|uniref:DUF4190 domain-containing protein n=1 Tax=Marinicrinis sediminis TaxID=1652465 RepID=A0ABW5RBB7_9BACL